MFILTNILLLFLFEEAIQRRIQNFEGGGREIPVRVAHCARLIRVGSRARLSAPGGVQGPRALPGVQGAEPPEALEFSAIGKGI